MSTHTDSAVALRANGDQLWHMMESEHYERLCKIVDRGLSDTTDVALALGRVALVCGEITVRKIERKLEIIP